MLEVIKRDGTIVPFDIYKINAAITKAFDSLHKQYDETIIELLSLRVSAAFQDRVQGRRIHVEDIQDCVENVLSLAGYTDVAKAYILYRKQRENVREIEMMKIEYKNIVDRYLKNEHEKSGDDYLSLYSVGGLILSNSAAITKNYWLSTIYDPQISRAHQEGDIYIHDLDMLTADSAGWSLKQLLKNGLQGMDKRIVSRPASHLFTACNQLVNFLGIMQNEWAGAQSIAGFDTYLAPFVKKDQMDQESVYKAVEAFIYGVNIPSRWGTQSPFSTVSFDWTVPSDLKEEKATIGGRLQDFTYGQCHAEMKQIQKAFLSILLEADSSGRSFPFPIPVVVIGDDFDWDDQEMNALLFEVSAKYGAPYYLKNKEAIQQTRNHTYSMDQLYLKALGYFGYGENTGSIGTVTLNLPRLTFLSVDETDFFERLNAMMDLMARCLQTKRRVLESLLQNGLYPYTKHFMGSFQHVFGTFGIVGMNEACMNAPWLKKDLSDPAAQDFSCRVLDHMHQRLYVYQEQYNSLFNLEATPGESVSYRLASLDREKFPKMKLEKKYYTNSTDLPVNYTEDVFEALDIEQKFLSKYTGGSVFHVHLKKRIPHWKQCMKLVNQIATHYNVSCFTISPTYCVCSEHGYFAGDLRECPVCAQKMEIWSRVAGYYQPVERWNEGKKEEFIQRQNYEV